MSVTPYALMGLQSAAGNRAAGSLARLPVLQRKFANAGVVPVAPPVGWAAGQIAHRDGALNANDVVTQAIENGAPIFTQAGVGPRARTSYLVPVLATTGGDVPGDAFWARFEGDTFVRYLAQDAVTQAFAYGHRASNEGGTMAAITKTEAADVASLIDNFTITSVTRAELTPSDYVTKLPGERSKTPRKRIDRQGAALGQTAARFAVQIGSPVYAGIHMPIDIDFPIDVVRAAFRASYGGRYRLLTRT